MILQNPGAPGVTVSTGPSGASANISILVNYTLQIAQDILYNETFDNGFPGSWKAYRSANGGCAAKDWKQNLTITWAGGSVECNTVNAISLAFSNTIAGFSGSVFLAAYVYAKAPSSGTKQAGVSYVYAPGAVYSSAYVAAVDLGAATSLKIVNCTQWVCSDANITQVPSLSQGVWYLIVFRADLSGATAVLNAALYNSAGSLLAALSYDTRMSSASFATNYSRAGLYVNETGGQFVDAYFDELVVALRDPRSVYVQNIPSGWAVYVLNSTIPVGNITSSGGEAAVGIAFPNDGQHSTILRQGALRIVDSSGTTRASTPQGLVPGGRVYVLQPQGISSLRILGIYNGDGKPYYGILNLSSISQTGFANISISICNSTACSSPIVVPGGPGSTSEILLPPGQAYVRLDATPSSSGAQASAMLILSYSTRPGLDGVVVSYPVGLEIR